jgi:hypothetical protein
MDHGMNPTPRDDAREDAECTRRRATEDASAHEVRRGAKVALLGARVPNVRDGHEVLTS